MKKNKTTIIAVLMLIAIFLLVNKDMNNGVSLTDSANAVSGWVGVALMFLFGKDNFIKDMFKK